MEPLEFAKGHGTGNDFVVIPDPDGDLVLTPKLVAGLCDRRFGIGADGVLRVVRTAADPTLSGTAEWFMDYRNADGSLAEMCGNGVRVFARYLVDRELVATGEVAIATRSGPVVAVVGDEAVSVTMGLPTVYGDGAARFGGGLELPGVAVNCGNPHLVCPLPAGLEPTDVDLSVPPVVDPGLFPDGANVEITAALGGGPGSRHQLRMRVHERGVGETRSCGSGACAAAAVALREAGQATGVVTIDLPGGRLIVLLTDDDCVLTGPAVLVARGTIDTSTLV